MSTRYTIPNQPEGLARRSIAEILANFREILGALNSFDGENIRRTSLSKESFEETLANQLGISQVGRIRGGTTVIAATERRESAEYGFLTTPDVVRSVQVPENGIVTLLYRAIWQESAGSDQANAAIFVGANQLKKTAVPSPVVQGTEIIAPIANRDASLFTEINGLRSTEGGYTEDVTTGQIITPCIFSVRGGTYDIGVKFLSRSGSVTVRNRKLIVLTGTR